MHNRTERIRALNDRLRATGDGGEIVITAGIASLPIAKLATILLAVQSFDQFTADNDPYGEHDFGSLDRGDGEPVFFKIDYYDRSMTGHSPDPADASVTRRVLTLMLASEY
jgi:hypothetical protein